MFNFKELFTNTDKILILEEWLGTRQGISQPYGTTYNTAFPIGKNYPIERIVFY